MAPWTCSILGSCRRIWQVSPRPMTVRPVRRTLRGGPGCNNVNSAWAFPSAFVMVHPSGVKSAGLPSAVEVQLLSSVLEVAPCFRSDQRTGAPICLLAPAATCRESGVESRVLMELVDLQLNERAMEDAKELIENADDV